MSGAKSDPWWLHWLPLAIAAGFLLGIVEELAQVGGWVRWLANGALCVLLVHGWQAEYRVRRVRQIADEMAESIRNWKSAR